VHVELFGAQNGGALHGFHIAFEGRVFLLVVHHQHVGLDVDRLVGTLSQAAEGIGEGLRGEGRTEREGDGHRQQGNDRKASNAAHGVSAVRAPVS
jgi:hypothetical protein